MNETSTPRSRGVAALVAGRAVSDGAGVRLNRVIGADALSELDPFLLLDEFSSDRPDDYLGGFPDHPHRGFETVTYMLDGRMRHRDSRGNVGLLEPGSVQWMTAGRGIVHSEMPEQQRGLLRGFQLWVNLPARDKLCEPRYQDIDAGRIPEFDAADGVRVRLIAGALNGRRGPVAAVATEPLYLDITLAAGARWSAPLETAHSAFVYVFEGDAAVGAGATATPVERGRLAVLDDRGDGVTLAAPGASARLLLVAGRPLDEPIVRYGPFVMNSEAEIHQALADFRAGRL